MFLVVKSGQRKSLGRVGASLFGGICFVVLFATALFYYNEEYYGDMGLSLWGLVAVIPTSPTAWFLFLFSRSC